MKFQVTMKDPDGCYDSMMDAAKEAAAQVTGVDEDERNGLVESKMEKIQELCSTWFEYGEYLTVEIDTDAGTAIVLKRKS